MTKHVKLFTPGPGDVEDDVLDAMATPVMRHYGPDYMPIFNETIGMLRQFFNTQNDIFMVPGPASALLDMGIGSLLSTGQKIIVGCNGFFGERLNDISRLYGGQIVPFSSPLGLPLDPQDLKKLLHEHPDAKLVTFIHHETGTTVMNPLRELAQMAHNAGRIVIVDCVSSMGGVEVRVDDWGVDVCVTSANKCLEALPGISFISVSPQAWAHIDQLGDHNHGWYMDLRTWRWFLKNWGSWHPTPVTMPVNNILAVHTSMKRITAGGLDKHFAKYAAASRAVRTGMKALEFEMLVPDQYASPIVTGVKKHPAFEVQELSAWLAEKRGMAIGGGLGELSGKIFRIGHLGKAAERDYLVEFLFSIEEFMRSKGIAVPTGASLTGF